MTAPTTAETPTMRNRLIAATLGPMPSLGERVAMGKTVDAILREMLEPTNGMMLAAVKADPGLENIWKAMIQHILNETKD